jgi:hypothetical protein
MLTMMTTRATTTSMKTTMKKIRDHRHPKRAFAFAPWHTSKKMMMTKMKTRHHLLLWLVLGVLYTYRRGQCTPSPAEV